MEEFGNGSMWLVWASNGLSWFVNATLYGALLVVVLSSVRRFRRDAMGWLLAATVMGLVVSVLGPVTGWAATLLGSRVGVDTMLLVQAGLGLFGTILHAVVFALLIRGIVALARPAAKAG
jgi:hypothetical protein